MISYIDILIVWFKLPNFSVAPAKGLKNIVNPPLVVVQYWRCYLASVYIFQFYTFFGFPLLFCCKLQVIVLFDESFAKTIYGFICILRPRILAGGYQVAASVSLLRIASHLSFFKHLHLKIGLWMLVWIIVLGKMFSRNILFLPQDMVNIFLLFWHIFVWVKLLILLL